MTGPLIVTGFGPGVSQAPYRAPRARLKTQNAQHKTGNGSAKGIIFSIDSMISLLLFLIVLVIISGSLVPSAPRTTSIKDLTYDILSVLDASGRYGRYVDGNSTAIREILINTPSNVCMDIYITKYLGNSSVVSKPNCGGYTRELRTTYGSFVYNEEYYTVRIEGWER